MLVFAHKNVVLIVLFVYLFDVEFRVLHVHSRLIIDMIGVLFFIGSQVLSCRKIKRQYYYLMSFAFVIILWDVFTCILNNNFELHLT